MKDVVIVSACRTAIGAFGGALKSSNAATIASITMKQAVERATACASPGWKRCCRAWP